VATFRGFPVCGVGATLTSDLAFAGGIALTVSDLGRTMQRFELAMRGGIGHMSDLERLLVPGCTELPACRCGKEMHLDHTLPLPTDTHIRVYRCLTCHYEMRLTVWGIDPLDQLNTLVIEPDRSVVSSEAERHPIPDTPAA
jgi:hypothetical protein